MGVLEIVLLLAGGVLALLSFVIPVAREEVPKETKELAQGEIKSLIGQEMDSIRQHVDDVVDEAVGYAVEKTERSLERLTNEKIMAVNEYSDTVLQEIHKNHEEAMFLYDMLNSKHNNLKNTVTEVNKTVKEVEETKREAEAVMNSFQQLKPESIAESFKPLMPETMQTREAVQTHGTAQVRGFTAAQESAPVKEVQSGLERLAMAQRGDSLKTEERASAESTAGGNVVTSAKTSMKASDEVNVEISAENHTEFYSEKSVQDSVKLPVDLSFMTTEQEPAESKNEQILRLHRQGKSTVAIAKELGLGVGEVKLVIDLYKNL